MSRHTAYDMYGRSAVYQANIGSVISLDLAMQSLYDGCYAVYMPEYSIGPIW